MMKAATTIPDLGRGWRIEDPVIQLREWGSVRTYEVPETTVERTVGSSRDCHIQLTDDRVSRVHARLVRDGVTWWIHDAGSKNGVWIDGMRRASFMLEPGVEIGLGGTSLIAESENLLALRRLLARLLGWAPEWRESVDRALRNIREAATLRAALVLCGVGDLPVIAARLHRETLGADRPFVLASTKYALAGISTAAGGTLCISTKNPPNDLEHVIAASREPDARVRLVICAPTSRAAGIASLMIGRVVRVPITSLLERRAEVPRIIAECADDAAVELDQPATGLDTRDHSYLKRLELESYADVYETTRRLVAIRTLGITEGASKLGITHGALSRWAQRRAIAT
jgi:hypothetical protein